MPKLTVGLYLHCLECFSYTQVGEGLTPSTTPCENCDSEVRDDPYCTELISVSECPNPGNCESDDHHYGLGQHSTDVEWS